VVSSCEFGNESSGSMKCWEVSSGLATGGLSISAQLRGVSYALCVAATECKLSVNYPESIV
jgi:hypothetical protein